MKCVIGAALCSAKIHKPLDPGMLAKGIGEASRIKDNDSLLQIAELCRAGGFMDLFAECCRQVEQSGLSIEGQKKLLELRSKSRNLVETAK